MFYLWNALVMHTLFFRCDDDDDGIITFVFVFVFFKNYRQITMEM